MPPPYFAAYLATKAALDAFGDSLMSELQHEGVHVSSVYLPLVKTDMMAPVEEYAGRRDVMTPKRAATMILDGVVDRRRRVLTPQGAFFAFSNRVTPATTSRILNLLQRTFPVGTLRASSRWRRHSSRMRSAAARSSRRTNPRRIPCRWTCGGATGPFSRAPDLGVRQRERPESRRCSRTTRSGRNGC